MTQASTTRKRAQEKRAQRRRQTQIRLFIGLGLAALVVAGLLVLLSRPQEAAEVNVDYQNLEQSIDESGIAPGYAVGDPTAAVTVTDYSDFSCPHCRDLAPIIHRIIDEYATTGQVRVVYKPIAFVSEQSVPAAKAAICAGDQGQFWQMHDAIWELNATAGVAGYTEALLAARADQLGLNRAEFSTCFNSDSAQATVDAILQEATSRNIRGTPTVYVNDTNIPYSGVDTFFDDLAAAIDAELNSETVD